MAADKTNNFYRLEVPKYKELLAKDIHNDYKVANDDFVNDINQKHKRIVRDLNINDRVFATANREAFVTLKGHKDNYKNNPKCRLLNPTKPEIGRV